MKPFEHMRAVRDADLPPSVRAAAWAIALRADAYGSAYPAVPRIAADTGLSRSTVLRALATLESAGWLHVVRTTGKHGKQANRYLLITPVDNSTDPADTDADRCHSDTSEVSPRHLPGSVTVTPRRSPHKKNSGERVDTPAGNPHLDAVIRDLGKGMRL